MPLLGFLNPSATCSSLTRPIIFRWVAFLRFVLQGFLPPAQVQRLVADWIALMTFFLEIGLFLT